MTLITIQKAFGIYICELEDEGTKRITGSKSWQYALLLCWFKILSMKISSKWNRIKKSF